MNSYQPQQQQQPQYRPNRAALWVNSSKSAPNQPDYKGNLEISWALLQELTAAFNAGQYEQDRGGQPCIKLDFALYAQQGGVSASGRAKPILSGQLATLADTQQGAAMRQQAAANRGGYGAPQQPQQPQGYAPAPMPQQPQPAYQQPPQQPAYPQPQAPQQPAAAPMAPAPMPQPVPAAAPPAMPVQPMPGAIHGQPPAAPAPTLPQGF